MQEPFKQLIKSAQVTALPPCILYSIRTFNHVNRLSNQASLEIRTKYRDVWNEYIRRPRFGRTEKFAFSNHMTVKFGRQRVSNFHELLQRRRDRRDWLTVQSPVLRAELRLASCANTELKPIVEWVADLNANNPSRVPNKWINWISPKHVSEIALWRLANMLG